MELSPRPHFIALIITALSLSGQASPTDTLHGAKSGHPKPVSHENRILAGWTVRVDERLLLPTNSELGDRALKLLEARLTTLAMVLPEKPLARLRQVPIQIDLTHGALHPMQYHPSADWLRGAGYATNLANCVHIPDASYFAAPYEVFRQPMAILHELAHAYHFQVLGRSEPRILKAFSKFRSSGRYELVLMNTGEKRRHYGLTDDAEFFAEMTEAYFGTNDFFPFVASELQREEPEIFALLRDIWGPLPSRE
jgi:hypothetical protein